MRQKLLFLDIETASQARSYEGLDAEWKELWDLKSRNFSEREKGMGVQEIYSARAAIYAEFGKIICISLGYQNGEHFRVTSFSGEEKSILQNFFAIVEKSYADVMHSGFAGHNIREFDIPYICRRATVLGLTIPPSLELGGKKPWDVRHIQDTLELWRFGDFKNFTSLDLLARCLGLPSSKSDISGKDVGHVYWELGDIDRIVRYCQQDVVLTARVYRRLKHEPEIPDESIEII